MTLLGIVPAGAADWRQEIGTFRIGMIAPAAPTAKGVEALRRSYAAALNMPVEFFIASDFAQLIDAQATSRIEYAIHSATSYATAVELCQCVEPIAAPTDIDGALGIRSILLARKQVASLADLPKAKLVVPPPDDVSGRLAPLALLSRDGLTVRGDEPFIVPASTVIDAESIFAKGEADALLGWERVSSKGDALLQGGTLDRLRRGGVDIDSLDRVWMSPVIPYGPHVVLKSLAPEARELLAGHLAGLHAADPQAYDLLSGGHAGGFVAVDEASYEAAREMVRAMVSTQSISGGDADGSASSPNR